MAPSYSGQYDANGRRHGHGRLELENGDVYEGNWADGRKQGSGVYSYGNGDVYDGEWKKNMRDGWGVYIRKSGGRVVGFWEHNECVQEVAARASLLPDPMEALDHDIKRQRPRVPLLQLEALQVGAAALSAPESCKLAPCVHPSNEMGHVGASSSLDLLAAMIDADDGNQLQNANAIDSQPESTGRSTDVLLRTKQKVLMLCLKHMVGSWQRNALVQMVRRWRICSMHAELHPQPQRPSYISMDFELGFYAVKRLLNDAVLRRCTEVVHQWHAAARETMVRKTQAYRHAVPVMLFRWHVAVLRACTRRCVQNWQAETMKHAETVKSLCILQSTLDSIIAWKHQEMQHSTIQRWRHECIAARTPGQRDEVRPPQLEVGIPLSILDSMNETELAGVLEAAEGAVARMRDKVEVVAFDALLEGSAEAERFADVERAEFQLQQQKLDGLRAYYVGRVGDKPPRKNNEVKSAVLLPKRSAESNTQVARQGRTKTKSKVSTGTTSGAAPFSVMSRPDSDMSRPVCDRDKENSLSPRKPRRIVPLDATTMSAGLQERTKRAPFNILDQRKVLEKERAAVARITLRPLRQLRSDALAIEEAGLAITTPSTDECCANATVADVTTSMETEPALSQCAVDATAAEATESASQYTVGPIVGLDAVSKIHTHTLLSPHRNQENTGDILSPQQETAKTIGQGLSEAPEMCTPSAMNGTLHRLHDSDPSVETQVCPSSCSPIHKTAQLSPLCTGMDASPDGHRKEWHSSSAFLHEDEVIYESGDRYQGDLHEGQRHGRGKCIYADGSCYDGEWNADQIHGQGLYTSGGGSYEGCWCMGVQSGFGIFKSDNGGTYAGEWDSGERHGNGVYTYANGDIYDGEWLHGMKSGEGSYQSATIEGESYTGQWHEGMKHGNGVTCNGIGDIHHGRWAHDLPNGPGLCEKQDGTKYDGDWKDGLYHGHGSWSDDGNCYEGEFVEGRRHGMGTVKLSTGDCYKGMWMDDQKHGNGSFQWLVGELAGYVYNGEFNKDQLEGQGELRSETGDSYNGQWHKGERHGEGTLVLETGEVYTGQWSTGQWSGYGSYTWKQDGVVGSYRGQWHAGLKHGEGRLTISSGESFDGQWYNGEKHGEGKWMGENGDTFDGEWRKGEKHGEGRYEWAPSEDQPGRMYYDGQWCSDQRHGEGSFVCSNTLGESTDSYTGQWQFDRYHGEGVYRHRDKFYKGQWYEGNRQGPAAAIDSVECAEEAHRVVRASDVQN